MRIVAAPRRAAAAALLAACLAAAGCEIADPALPVFTTRVSVPIGTHELTVTELLEDQDHVVVGADSLLVFGAEGDTTTVDLDLDLTAELAGLDVAAELGAFALPDQPPRTAGFTLAEIAPEVAALPPVPLPVPAFAIDLRSDPSPLDRLESARLAAGRLEVRLRNGLPVPVSGASAPERLVAEVLDGDGAVVTTVVFDGEIAPGDSAAVQADLAGAVLSGGLAVRLQGGSPGAAAAVVTPGASLSVTMRLTGLVVDEATARVEALAFAESGGADLPDEFGVLEATIGSGVLDLALDSGLDLPCAARVTFPQMRDLRGDTLVVRLDLPAGGDRRTVVDLAGCTITAGGGAPLTRLTYDVAIASPGSGEGVVTLSADAALSATIAPLTLAFAEVQGVFPREEFAFAPRTETIDIPDDLDGVRLASATLVVDVFNGTGLGGEVALSLVGRNAAGDEAELSVVAAVAPARAGGEARTSIVLDEHNSNIAELLSLLPEELTFAGAVSVGGDGWVGTVRPGDRARACWRVDAPLRLELLPSETAFDPEPLDLDDDLRRDLDRHLETAAITAVIGNHLPFGVEVTLQVGPDSLSALTAPELVIGPLAVTAGLLDDVGGYVSATTDSRHVIALDRDQVRALTRPGAFTVAVATLPGTGGRTVTLRSVDRVTVSGALTAEITVSEDDE
ncbi:MAG: hypothetical protein IPM94_04115 [bacterium]|nr:hypothetical protein [bacterium]